MNEREANIHLAKVYLQQARLTKHRNWAFVLLALAANRRKSSAQNRVCEIEQMELFA